MKAQLVEEVLSRVEARVKSQPSPIEFEMAYQVRVAIDRIRFAIKATDQFANHPQQPQEVNLQLLDALDRLESADRNLQVRFRKSPVVERRDPLQNTVNGRVDHSSNGARL